MIHAGSLDNPRLKAVLDALRAAPDGCTTFELHQANNGMAAHTDVAELRANGINIECKYERTENGRRVYKYRLLPASKITENNT